MVPDAFVASTQVALEAAESYGDLLRSGPHWLFELTLELITAPLAFAVGWLWRRGLLSHLHRDLRALRSQEQPREAAPGSTGDCPGERTGEGAVEGALDADGHRHEADSWPRGPG